jgi:hypothetical protein
LVGRAEAALESRRTETDAAKNRARLCASIAFGRDARQPDAALCVAAAAMPPTSSATYHLEFAVAADVCGGRRHAARPVPCTYARHMGCGGMECGIPWADGATAPSGIVRFNRGRCPAQRIDFAVDPDEV